MATSPGSGPTHVPSPPPDRAEPTDGQLLADYLSRRDETAFAALVHRYGPMVWSVCHRVLRNHHAVEDAFQATFLVLARRASSIAARDLLANWLYGVAYRTALKARATTARRSERERQVTPMPEPVATEQCQQRDLQHQLDEALSRLPGRYRAAIVLCDLEGKTRQEVAGELGCPEGTVASRLARARTMLAKQLRQRGVALSAGVAALLGQEALAASLPSSVIGATLKSASALAAGNAAGAVSVEVAALTEGVLRAMLYSKVKAISAVVLLLGIVPCSALLLAVVPAFGQHAHHLDFRNSNFDPKLVDYTLAAPEKYLTPEKEGLRLRFTGVEAPPARQAAGVSWRFDARGDFVVTAKYEILTMERPKTGQGVGAGLYLHLKNREQEGIALARRFQPTGDPYLVFNYMTTKEQGGNAPKVFKKFPAGDGSMRGAFRLARQGKVLIASFAEEGAAFTELHRTDVSTADLDLIRFAGFGGGDKNAVLDLRILEFDYQGEDLAYRDGGFALKPPVAAEAPVAANVAESVQPRSQHLLVLAGLCLLLLLLALIAVTVQWRRQVRIHNDQRPKTRK
jgi:RNA polymerase sigma factor (sigma-70 family)